MGGYSVMKAITRVMMDCTNILNYLLGESSNLFNTYIISLYNIYIHISICLSHLWNFGKWSSQLLEGFGWKSFAELEKFSKIDSSNQFPETPLDLIWRSSPSPPRMLEAPMYGVLTARAMWWRCAVIWHGLTKINIAWHTSRWIWKNQATKNRPLIKQMQCIYIHTYHI